MTNILPSLTMTPFEITTGTLAVANGTFSVATNFWKLRSVDDDLKVCLRLLGIITQDLNEARKLRSRKFSHDCSSEDLLARVDNAIEDLDIAAKDVGTALEASRVEKATKNKISIAKRFGWVFNGKDQFQAQQWAVNAAHNRLLQIITTMEARPDTLSLTVSPPPYEDVILRSPSQKRAGTGKTTSIIIETNAVFPYEDAAQGGLDPPTTLIGNLIPVIEEVAQPQVILGSPSRLKAREGRRTSDVGITDATPTSMSSEVLIPLGH